MKYDVHRISGYAAVLIKGNGNMPVRLSVYPSLLEPVGKYGQTDLNVPQQRRRI